MKLQSINPFNNQLLTEYEEYEDERVDEIILLAKSSFKHYGKTSFAERAEKMQKAAELLMSEKEKFARTITLEMGKILKESIAEVEKCAWVCRYYAEKAEKFLESEAIKTDAQQSYVTYEPLGCVLAVMPWNFPFWQVFRFAAPALMAGNVALLKHASNVQGCARHIEDIFLNAGFPQGVFQNLVIGSSKVQRVIENDAIKAVTLTGSELAGSKVAETAGKNIKKSVLELGGSNAFIVLEDADMDKAVEVGVTARFMNCGQSCIAAKRFILHKSIADQYVELFKSKVEALSMGDPLDYKTTIGLLASEKQAELLHDQVLKSVEQGAEILLGGKQEGAFYHPTIITKIKPGMPVFDEELFGPVAPIIIVENVEEAIEITNLSEFGLGVSVFTNDINKAKAIASEFDDGAVFINSLVKSDPRLPFGGTKKSGYGRELSYHGIREFVNIKTVFIS